LAKKSQEQSLKLSPAKINKGISKLFDAASNCKHQLVFDD